MNSTHNEGKSLVAERFIRSCFGYLNKLVDEYYSALSKEIESSHKSPKFKLAIESELPSITKFLAKVTLNVCQKKYLLLILC